jgi:TolA-binding protein
MTTTAPATVTELQDQVVKLKRQVENLRDDKALIQDQLDEVLEREKDAQEHDERQIEHARQIVVNHHDEANHRGSQRFCTEAPCPALNALFDEWEVR